MRRAVLLPLTILAVGCFKAAVDTVPREMIEKLAKTTTPEAIREWLITTAATRLSETNRIQLPPASWPPWIAGLSNRNDFLTVTVERTNANVSAFVTCYARPHHGLDLHTSTNTPPRDDSSVRIEMWVPGMYAWFASGD